MKNIKLIFFLLIFQTAYCQVGTVDEILSSDNDYLIANKITDLEEENKKCNQQIEECEILLNMITSLNADYKSLNIDNIELKDSTTLESIRLAFDDFDGLDMYDYENFKNYKLLFIATELQREVDKVYLPGGSRSILIARLFDDKKTSFDAKDINDIRIKQSINDVINESDKAISEVESIKTELEEKISTNIKYLSKLYKKKGTKTDLHKTAIMMGLPAFCITILLLFLIPYYLERNEKKGVENLNGKEQSIISNKQYLLDVATVLLLTMTILILGLAKMITGEVLGTLLGGISGYVLNRTMKK